MTFLLQGAPCIECPGNDYRCSWTDTTEKYNALTCELITEWINIRPPVTR